MNDSLPSPTGGNGAPARPADHVQAPVDRELEIKFETDPAGLQLALDSEALATPGPERPRRTLRSVYFDTSMGDLRRNRVVLRVRNIRGGHVMGAKWTRAVQQGAFSRREVEVRVPSAEPDL